GGPTIHPCALELPLHDGHPRLHAPKLVAEVRHDLVRRPDQAVHGLLWRGDEGEPLEGYPGVLRYPFPERTERGFDALPRLRTRHDRWGVVLLVEVVRVLVRGHPLLLEEVHLVPDDHHRDLPDEPPHHRHPVLLHGAEGGLSREMWEG